MWQFLKNLFNSEEVKKKYAIDIKALLTKSEKKIDYDQIQELSKMKLKELDTINDELSLAALQIKLAAEELKAKLNKHVDNLDKNIHQAATISHQGIITFNSSGKIKTINHAIEDTFGYRSEELINQSVEILFPFLYPHDPKYGATMNLQTLMPSVSKLIYTNLHLENELGIKNFFSLSNEFKTVLGISKSSEYIVCDINVNIINPNVDEPNELEYICIITNIEKINNQVKNYDYLKHCQLSIIEAIPNPVYWKANDLNIIGCNNAFESLLGLWRSDLIGKSVQHALDDRSKFHDEILLRFSPTEITKILEYQNNMSIKFQNLNYNDDAVCSVDLKMQDRKAKKLETIVLSYKLISNPPEIFSGIICSILNVSVLTPKQSFGSLIKAFR
jgi:PAS domain-containing protein